MNELTGSLSPWSRHCLWSDRLSISQQGSSRPSLRALDKPETAAWWESAHWMGRSVQGRRQASLRRQRRCPLTRGPASNTRVEV